MFFSNIRIANKLVLGYAVILVFFIVTSILSFYYISKIWANEKELYEHPFKVSNAARNVKIGVLNIRRYMLHMAVNSSPETITEMKGLMEHEESKTIREYLQIKDSYLGDSKDIQISYTSFLKWKPLREEALKEIESGYTARGRGLILNQNRAYVDSLFQTIDRIINFANAKALSFYTESNRERNETVILLITLCIFSTLIAFFFAIFITRSIIVPLKKMVSSIDEISRGNITNHDLTESKDEIGMLATSFNVMQRNLLNKVQIADLISQGIFTEKLISVGPNDILANAINKIADNFDLVVKQAQRVALGDYGMGDLRFSNTNPLGKVLIQMRESLKEVVESARRVSLGDYSGTIIPKSASDELALALNQMNISLRKMSINNQRQDLLKSAVNELNGLVRGDMEIDVLAKKVITYIAKCTNSQLGVFYLWNNQQRNYQLIASYAFTHRKGNNTSYREGEGLVGQAALEKEIITFNNVPDDYIRISSGLGDMQPRHLMVVPLVYVDHVAGVFEIGSVDEFSPDIYEFVREVQENIAITLLSAINRTEMSKLLQHSQEMSEELQVQQEELRQANEELEEQTKALRKSEEFLQTQQEELRVTNEELEEKTRFLENQKNQIEKQNADLENARVEIERKANDLEITNKYKSEFLANMSHELRTPLNSLLILSQSLAENKKANMNADQVESAQIIYNSGTDLLNLINDILDLSKIESGKMQFTFEKITLDEIIHSLQSTFKHVLKQKNLEFDLSVDSNLPTDILTDKFRLNQVLRNFMSNAIKFTEKGRIGIFIYKPLDTEDLHRSRLNPADAIAISVKDTGIGIAKEKQLEIFEAFQQADGSISRKYGGTGLGLSVSKELVKILGGEIKLKSKPGEGSEFIIFLPLDSESVYSKYLFSESKRNKPTNEVLKKRDAPVEIAALSTKEPLLPEQYNKIVSVTDDREIMQPGDKSILIVEDDIRFAEIVSQMCRQKGFKCLATSTGEEAMELAQKYKPLGIVLDIKLPGINGWQVLESLKNNAATRHIPVHIMSGFESTMEAFNKGAMGYFTKPVTKEKLEDAFNKLESFITKKIKDLLIIEDDDNLRKSIKRLLGATDLIITECNSGNKAMELIRSKDFDCVVLDLGLPDMTGFELLRMLKESHVKIPPVVVYTGKEISRDENDELMRYTQNIIIKGVKSDERLLDETALFLHRVVGEMPEQQKQMLISLYDKDKIFENKKILVVDDDMRNVFALTQVLEANKIKVVMAPNGQKALDELNKNSDIDLVLMDIMMPIMDGYEAMQMIRKDKRFLNLPIIALTAKAMKEDRDKSIASGANDYLSKPVDIEKLFNLIRIWLYQ